MDETRPVVCPVAKLEGIHRDSFILKREKGWGYIFQDLVGNALKDSYILAKWR